MRGKVKSARQFVLEASLAAPEHRHHQLIIKPRAMVPSSAKSLSSSLDKLQIGRQSKTVGPVDSWEDEEEGGTGSTTPVRPSSSSQYPGPPPPTPASPSFSSQTTLKGFPFQTFPPYGMNGAYDSPERSAGPSPAGREGVEKRPEKTTAVATRLIAAGIGQKVPRRTKEQREYDQAMQLQGKKKRDLAKEEEERAKQEKERAKQAVWDD